MGPIPYFWSLIMDTNQRIFWQEEIEKKYNRKHIDGYLREAILGNPEMETKIQQGVVLLEGYRSKHYTYMKKDVGVVDFDSKNKRVKQLELFDLERLVLDIFVGVAYCQREELFTSVTAQLAGRLKFSDKKEAIQTVAEMLAVLCATDAFDITKQGRMGSLMVISRIPLPDALIDFIEHSAYLPPMVCEPKALRSNYDSGYLTHSESLILGSGNHHDGDLTLDVLNTMNKVALKLDLDFLSTVEEEPTFDLNTQDKIDDWKRFKTQSYRFYKLIADYGNTFHLTHRVDKRGRIYSSGYWINTQGAAFKKAAIELANEELIEVPDGLRRRNGMVLS